MEAWRWSDSADFIVSDRFATLDASSGINVIPAVLSSIRLEPGGASLPLGTVREFRLLALFSDQSEQDVTLLASLTVEDPSIVSFDSGSTLRARAVGTTRLLASYEGLTARAEVAATPAVTSGAPATMMAKFTVWRATS